jgi:hypothetical protein
VVHDPAWDVNAGGLDGVAELHRVVHLVHQQTIGRFENVDRHDAAADRARGAARQIVQLGRHGALGRAASPRGVGDPVVGGAIDRSDRLLSDDERADVSSGLAHVLLHVVDRVDVRPEQVLVLEDGLRGVAIVHLGDEPPPRADQRFEHRGVAEFLDRGERGLGREGQPRSRGGQSVADQPQRGEQLVAADVRDLEGVDGRNPVGGQDGQRVQRAAVLDAALQHEVHFERGSRLACQDELAIVDDRDGHPTSGERFEQELLLDPHAGEQDADPRSA